HGDRSPDRAQRGDLLEGSAPQQRLHQIRRFEGNLLPPAGNRVLLPEEPSPAFLTTDLDGPPFACAVAQACTVPYQAQVVGVVVDGFVALDRCRTARQASAKFNRGQVQAGRSIELGFPLQPRAAAADSLAGMVELFLLQRPPPPC